MIIFLMIKSPKYLLFFQKCTNVEAQNPKCVLILEPKFKIQNVPPDLKCAIFGAFARSCNMPSPNVSLHFILTRFPRDNCKTCCKTGPITLLYLIMSIFQLRQAAWSVFQVHSSSSRAVTKTFILLCTALPPDYRTDGKCGPDFPGPNGEEGICLGDGIWPCCSTNGRCGNTIEHCETSLHRDFRGEQGNYEGHSKKFYLPPHNFVNT